MNTLIAVDLDGTIVEYTRRLAKAGIEPPREPFELYQSWLDRVQTPEDLMTDPAVPGMKEFVRALASYSKLNPTTKVIYLTARHESLRNLTCKWLHKNGFPGLELFMREESDISENHNMKRKVIRSLMIDGYDSVVICDDDPSGGLQKVCAEESWSLLKMFAA
jgi:hypothetical protein